METTVKSIVEALPDEILEIIFSFCTLTDVIESFPNVCSRWRRVVQSFHVWKHLAYCPNEDANSEEIVEKLKISPNLQILVFKNEQDDAVLQAVTDNCANLRKLQISRRQDMKLNFLKNLQEKCPKIEHLKVEDIVLANKHMCEVIAKLTNLKVLILTGFRETGCLVDLKPVADHCKELEHFEFRNYEFELPNLRYFLSKRRKTLHTLGVRCCTGFGKCVLPAVSTCKLKSLSLFAYFICGDHQAKKKYLGRLKTLKQLTLETSDYEKLVCLKQIFANGNMAQLTELSIYTSNYFTDHLTDVIVRNCPLIHTLTLDYCIRMTDLSLKRLHNLKQLSSLTISRNALVTDNGIFHLQDLQHLKRLRIARCLGLTKLSCQTIATLSSLQDLVLWEQDLAEFPWDLIPYRMKYLRCLEIWYCDNVDMCAVENLKRSLPCLRVMLDGITDSPYLTLDDSLVCKSKIFVMEY